MEERGVSTTLPPSLNKFLDKEPKGFLIDDSDNIDHDLDTKK